MFIQLAVSKQATKLLEKTQDNLFISIISIIRIITGNYCGEVYGCVYVSIYICVFLCNFTCIYTYHFILEQLDQIKQTKKHLIPPTVQIPPISHLAIAIGSPLILHAHWQTFL